MACACLAGAQVGIQGIPQRFIEGLVDKDEILANAESCFRFEIVTIEPHQTAWKSEVFGPD